MAMKQKESAPLRGKPALRVVEKSKVLPAEPAPQQVFPPETFADPRSGRDRRHARGETNDPRRVNGERRRTCVAKPWWLEKNYVDAHFFTS